MRLLIVSWREWVGEGELRLKLDVQDQGGEKILDVDGQRSWGS